MASQWAVRLSHTSENTVVYNLLHDMVDSLQRYHRRHVTIISPTSNEEHYHGFDALVDELPGTLIAFQFKRPTKTGSSCANFVIDNKQHETLCNKFPIGQASYVFCPVPSTLDFIVNRHEVLQRTLFPDVHSIPLCTKKKTRTFRIPQLLNQQPNQKHRHRGEPCPGITDPRTYFELPETCLRKWGEVRDRALENGIKTGNIPHVEEIDRPSLGRVHYLFMPELETL